MKLILIIILFCSCSFPKHNQYELIRCQIVEINKVELGYNIVWEDYRGREFNEFQTDTTGCKYHIGTPKELLVQR